MHKGMKLNERPKKNYKIKKINSRILRIAIKIISGWMLLAIKKKNCHFYIKHSQFLINRKASVHKVILQSEIIRKAGKIQFCLGYSLVSRALLN